MRKLPVLLALVAVLSASVAYAGTPTLSKTLFIPSVLRTYTGVPGIDGVHLVEHQQELVIVNPWTPERGCVGTNVLLSFLTNRGETIGQAQETIPTCGRLVVESPDIRYGLNLDGILIKIESDVPVAANWRLRPAYEWPVPTILQEVGRGLEEAGHRFLLYDVAYNNVTQDNGPTPPHVPTFSRGFIKVVNPGENSVVVAIEGYDDERGETFSIEEVAPAHGEVRLELHLLVPEFKGQVVVQVMSGGPVLVWGWHFQIPRSYSEAPLIITELPFVRQ